MHSRPSQDVYNPQTKALLFQMLAYVLFFSTTNVGRLEGKRFSVGRGAEKSMHGHGSRDVLGRTGTVLQSVCNCTSGSGNLILC